MNAFRTLVFSAILSAIALQSAFAATCTKATKAKYCAPNVSYKVKYHKGTNKAIKLGKVTHAAEVVQLGALEFDAAPSNPAPRPESYTVELVSTLVPAEYAYYRDRHGHNAELTGNQLQGLRNRGDINADGTLTARAIRQGYRAVLIKPATTITSEVTHSATTPQAQANHDYPRPTLNLVEPNQIAQKPYVAPSPIKGYQAPELREPKAPNQVQQTGQGSPMAPAPMTPQAPNLRPPKAPNQIQPEAQPHSPPQLAQATPGVNIAAGNKAGQPTRPNTNGGHAGTQSAANAAMNSELHVGTNTRDSGRGHSNKLVEVYYATSATVLPLKQAEAVRSPGFHLIVVGFKEPTALSAKTEPSP